MGVNTRLLCAQGMCADWPVRDGSVSVGPYLSFLGFKKKKKLVLKMLMKWSLIASSPSFLCYIVLYGRVLSKERLDGVCHHTLGRHDLLV